MNEGQCEIKTGKKKAVQGQYVPEQHTMLSSASVGKCFLPQTPSNQHAYKSFKELTFAQLCNANRPVAYLVSTWPDV